MTDDLAVHSTFEATDENDLEVTMVVSGGGTHIDTYEEKRVLASAHLVMRGER